MIRKTSKKIVALLLLLLMVMTTIPSISFAGTASDQEWWNFRNSEENNGVTDRPAITSEKYANLKWGVKYGTGWAAAPTPPLILDDYLYIGVGKNVKKISKETGECVATSGNMIANVGYALNPILYADGKLFVQVGNGMIQALDYSTLQPLWHTEKIGGQTLCPITYKKIDGKGYLFTGTWSGEKKDGKYFCVTTDDENVTEGVKTLEWTFTPATDDTALAGTTNINRGFYWAGSYATENYVAFGSDDGTNEGDYTANGVFYTVNPKTGEVISRIDGIKGDVRSTTVFDDGHLYFATKGGLLYKVDVSETGELTNPSMVDLGGMATASALVYNGRLYIGVAGQGGQFDADGGHHFAVVDITANLNSDSIIYTIPIKGYPQAAALMSTSEVQKDFNNDGRPDGRVYIYFTYNANPGGIYYIYDEPGQTAPSGQKDLFVPPTEMQQYCISTLCMDRKGTIYYKNDSCYLMAIENNKAFLEGMSVETDAGDVKWGSAFAPGTLSYTLKLPTTATKATFTLNLPENTTAEINGNLYSETNQQVTLNTDSDATIVTVRAISEENNRTYTLNLVKQSSIASLSALKVNGSNSYSGTALSYTPGFDANTFEYTTAMLDQSKAFYNVWPDLTSVDSTITIFGVENVQTDTMNDDKSIDITASNSGHNRYAIYAQNPKLDSKIRIEVKSENGIKTNNYYVTLSRKIDVTEVSLNETNKDLDVGSSFELEPTVTPSNASITDVTWSSSNKKVATVDDTGRVKGISAGTAVITVTTKDGSKTAQCTVTVKKTLEIIRDEANKELNSFLKLDNYRAAEKKIIEEKLAAAEQLILQAQSESEVNEIVESIEKDLLTIKTIAQYKAEEPKTDKKDAGAKETTKGTKVVETGDQNSMYTFVLYMTALMVSLGIGAKLILSRRKEK